MTMFSTQPLELSGYLEILRRRRWLFTFPAAVVAVIGIAIAFALPAVYKSEATFLIQRQSIPSHLVATTVTGYIQEQIEQIRQRIVTHSNLVDIAEKYALYPEQVSKDPRSVVEKLREDIQVAMVDVEASDPDQRGTRFATVAFTVGFLGETPAIAAEVTEEISQRFLNEHREAREARAEEVSDFLEEEANRLRIEIDDLETLLAGFKQQEFRQLPELMGMNLNLFERTEQQIKAGEERIRGSQERLDALAAELSLTDPYEEVRDEEGRLVLSGSKRLSALTAEYIKVTARYSSVHPDVKRLAREIRVLAEQTGDSARTDEIMSQLITIQNDLRKARQQYSDDHPEVANLERAAAALQRGLQTAIISGQDNSAVVVPPDNPRYVALQTELESRRTGIRAEREELAQLKQKLEEYETRLFQTPIVERDYKALARDYDNASQKYKELKEKQMQARLAQELESGESGEKFILTSPAYLPKLPDSPNRIGILLITGLFAFAAGIFAVALAEYMDRTIRSARMIGLALGSMPLVTIPRMEPVQQPTAQETG